MSHSFKKSLQKEILHRSSIAVFTDLSFTTHFYFWFFLFFTKAATLQRHKTDCKTGSRNERSK